MAEKYQFEKATYQAVPEKHGNGMFYYTDCCSNKMFYTFNDDLRYHGALCPKCFWVNHYVTLYLRGTPEANEVIKMRGW